jgi:hypothetical protein
MHTSHIHTAEAAPIESTEGVVALCVRQGVASIERASNVQVNLCPHTNRLTCWDFLPPRYWECAAAESPTTAAILQGLPLLLGTKSDSPTQKLMQVLAKEIPLPKVQQHRTHSCDKRGTPHMTNRDIDI